ncbi:hypothetical protein [Halohasta litorea]|uniref:Uncharacterized protein n=2 Tax=Haloferacaceae TaxID=1644056 RepID=A0ABD6DDN4_9EURY|nr:hypothetical protein [Halohasta litorea]
MSSESSVAVQPQAFQHQPHDGDCACPIHRNRQQDPFTAPLGLPFSNHVHVESIPQQWAVDIYDEHHGYMGGSDLHNANFTHHGLFYQNNLTGAITWRYPPFSLKKLHFDTDGELMPQPYTESDFEKLPPEMEYQARDLFEDISEGDVGESVVLEGDKFAEANRICIGVKMANLASCSLAASQETFVDSEACPDSVEYLITFVRADFEGSMIKALRTKGWQCLGWSIPKQASNRDYKAIRDRYKWVFACPVETVREQAMLSDWR